MSEHETGGARARILSRVRNALESRETVAHPGEFGGWRPAPDDDAAPGSAVERFEALFRAAGGESARVADLGAASAWIADFARDFPSVTLGRGVPPLLRPHLAEAEPDRAALGVSMALGAVAETGSLLLDARDGRRSQLLAPTHVVVVPQTTVHATLVQALASMREDLPSAVGLHSGPSKSADIGQVMVRGVHGPGRVIALFLTDEG